MVEMADKKRHRSHSSPTGITPHRQSKRAPLRYSKSTAAHLEPRRLTLDATEVTAASTGTPEPNSSATAVGSRACTWTDDETRALLKFVLLYGPSDKWPATKDPQLWARAADFVRNRGNGRTKHSGNLPFSTCRY